MIAVPSSLHLFAATLLALSLAGCRGRSPSIDVLGSYFPAWFVCFFAGLGLVLIVRSLLIAARIPLACPALVYPSLFAIFTMTTWLIFYCR